MIETLASLLLKDGSLEDALVFVPTRRAGRALEKALANASGGAAALPKIVGLGEGDDDEPGADVVGDAERKAVLAQLLL